MALSSTRKIADGDYLLARAEVESRMAEHARSPKAEIAHHQLASAYLDRLFGPARSEMLSSPKSSSAEARQALSAYNLFRLLIRAAGSWSFWSAFRGNAALRSVSGWDDGRTGVVRITA